MGRIRVRLGRWGLALLVAVGLGTAWAGSSATQTIRVSIGAFTRAEASWVPLAQPGPDGQRAASPRAQGVGTLGYTRTTPVRVLVGSAGDLPATYALEVRLRGAAEAVRVGPDHADLSGAAPLPGGVHTLALDYELTGAPAQPRPVPVVYTILDP